LTEIGHSGILGLSNTEYTVNTDPAQIGNAMPDNQIPTIVRPAKPGSKQGWVTVSGEVPPDVGEAWKGLMERRGCFQTDLVREAVELLLMREARKGRREQAGRRKTDVAA
jgi:hypothetical protein